MLQRWCNREWCDNLKYSIASSVQSTPELTSDSTSPRRPRRFTLPRGSSVTRPSALTRRDPMHPIKIQLTFKTFVTILALAPIEHAIMKKGKNHTQRTESRALRGSDAIAARDGPGRDATHQPARDTQIDPLTGASPLRREASRPPHIGGRSYKIRTR